MSVDNESVHALTGAYVLDALELEEQAAFEQHLAVCPDCREEVRSLRSAVVRLPAISAVEPPAELRASVLAAISAVRPLPPLPEQAPPAPSPAVASEPENAAPPSSDDELATRRDRNDRRDRRDRRANRWRLVAAAASVVALAGVSWGLLQPRDDLGREVSQVERETDSALIELMSAPDLQVYTAADADGVNGTVLRSESLDSAAMLLQDLPPVTADEVYQAWTITGETPTSAGVFNAADGSATVLLEGDVTSAEVMAVTIEPSGGSETPTGDVLVQVPVAS